MWRVSATQEYLRWFGSQSGEIQKAVLAKVLLLEEYGPLLGRPHADTLKGSRIRNLKELRASTGSHDLRVLYFFDEERQGLLLAGGDKRGKNSRLFYRSLVAEAESLVQRMRGRKEEMWPS
jgi:hypothetical protein